MFVDDYDYSYKKYKKSIMDIYKKERLESYYYPTVKELLLSSCSEEEDVISVYDNKSESSIHNQGIYAEKKGLQDLIIVPNTYTYENPQKPFVTIEVKRPDIDIDTECSIITRYNNLKVKNNEGQLLEHFKKVNYIIFTDCITWYLLTLNDDKIIIEKDICLIENIENNWVWKSNLNQFSNEFAFNNITKYINEEEPKAWSDLKTFLKEFIEESKYKLVK